MSDSITPVQPVLDEEKNEKSTRPNVRLDISGNSNRAGSIAEQIGTGEHAKDSFIWMTLKYCFYLGALFSVGMFIAFFHFTFDRNEPDKIEIIAALKDIWSIFTPILTLALGYAFGKKDRGD